MNQPPTIHTLPGQHFDCTACGKCCRGNWNIAVDRNAYREIEGSEAFTQRKKEGYVPLVVSDQGTSVGRREDGGCVFLNEDNLCGVHGELGAESKPLVCRTYPHLLARTPDGYFASLSFACPAALNNAGQSMEARKNELAEMLAGGGYEVPHNTVVEQQVPLLDEVSLAWSDYLRLESHLMTGFKPQYPVTSLLAMAEQLMEAVYGNELETLLENGFRSHALPDSYNVSLLEFFAVNCLSIMEHETEPQKRPEISNALLDGRTSVSPRHGMELPVFNPLLNARMTDVSVFRSYFQNIVFGKRLLKSPLLNELLTLAVGFSLLLYYREAFSAVHAERESLEKAFELVEGDLVTHSWGLTPLLAELPKAMQASRAVPVAAA